MQHFCVSSVELKLGFTFMHAVKRFLCVLHFACFEGYHVYSNKLLVGFDIICITAFRKAALEAQLLDLCFISW